MEAENRSKVIAVDIKTCAYALDENAFAAAKRLRARRPNAEIWFVRVGHRTLHRIGRRSCAEREMEAVVEGISCFITLPPAFTIPLGLTSDGSTCGDREWRRS